MSGEPRFSRNQRVPPSPCPRLRPSSRHHLQDVLGEHFRLERRLESVPTARVFVAHDIEHDRLIVLKVLRAETASSVDYDRFRRETRLAACLRHPNLVPLLTAGEVHGTLYYTMPFIPGETLRHRLRRERILAAPDAIRVLLDVARALEHAHENGIVHRDVKPENILLHDGRAFVTDLGIAKAIVRTNGESTLTAHGVTVGTPGYMAPEQAVGDPTLDHRADLYALGVVGYEMVVGSPPFGSPGREGDLNRARRAGGAAETTDAGAAPTASAPGATSYVALVLRLLSTDREARPSTGEVVRALEQMAQEHRRRGLLDSGSRRTLSASALRV
jgi:serine/threonine protein kinase